MLNSILSWYIVLQLLAWVGWPLAFTWLRGLRSRGYAMAKALGILLTGVVFWWGGILHIWGNTTSAVLVAAALVFVLGLWLIRGHWAEVRPWWQEHRAFVITTEVVFLVAFVFWALVRATQPQLETAGGEKWMEIAFLNAVLRSPHIPPHDPWLSGYAISYYYLGYFLMGMLARLAAIPASIAFNLSNAAWYALIAVGAYGIVYDLLACRDANKPKVGHALFGPLMLLVTGNAEGVLEVFHARGWFPGWFWAWLDIRHLDGVPEAPFSWVPQRFFWWWQASRVIRDYVPGTANLAREDRIPLEVIDEFPAFSLLLGDMHPHVLALPFVLLVIALALHIYRQGITLPAAWTLRNLGVRIKALAGYAVILGALGFLNTWDLPFYWALIVGAFILHHYNGISVPRVLSDGDDERKKPGALLFDVILRLLPDMVLLGVLSVGLYFPFWFALRSQAGGILPNLFHPTRLPQFVVMFLPLLLPVSGIIWAVSRRTKVRGVHAVLLGLGLVLGIALLGLVVGLPTAYPILRAALSGQAIQGVSIPPEVIFPAIVARLANPWTVLVLALSTGALILAILGRERGTPLPQSLSFPSLMVLLGVLFTLAPEFVYLRDIFLTRMNTIFKFYFQAWILWSLAGAWQLACWLEDIASDAEIHGGRYVLTLCSALFIAMGLVYTAFAVPARAKEHGVPWTLDGKAWLDDVRPQDAAAIKWINAHISGIPVIVEAPAESHRAYVYEGRISALTGLPTVLGWSGHEHQWRGNYDEPARREADLDTLFNTTDQALARVVLERYNVRYVYVGPVERNRYAEEGLAKFADMFPAVYAVGDVEIYQVRE